MSTRLTPLKIVAAGGAIAIIIVAYALTVANPPQCPPYYQPVEGDRCIIGANIGLGLLLLLADGVLVVTGIIALSTYGLAAVRGSKTMSAWVPRVMAASIVSVLSIYGVVRLLHVIAQHCIRS